MPEVWPTSIDELPGAVPMFPLSGVLLLPRGQLPLNVFEERYINMVRDAMATDRSIGIIQPRRKERVDNVDHPEVYETGCLGRITEHRETEDGRILITLTGLCRFEVAEELPLLHGYRRVTPRYDDYADDLAESRERIVDRPRLLQALKAWIVAKGIAADWDSIRAAPDERLVTALAMMCPFAPNEKQALLECHDLIERGRVMTALIEMSLLGGGAQGPEMRH